MDKLVIIDLEKNDHEIFEKNCFYINCNKGNIIIQNGKKVCTRNIIQLYKMAFEQ